MAKQVEYVDWPDAMDVWTPYTPAVAVRGGRPSNSRTCWCCLCLMTGAMP